ncbi:ubiquinol-cytochrome c reductase core subunit 1 [Ceratobasidium sp. 395]|nr:ubiquinol-cytochrome c reductase core subunit 1 [Ceratobasidium sp. 395]
MLSRTTRTTLRAVRSFATVVDAAGTGGLKVAAVDNGQPVSAVTLLVKAGSRYEPQQGAAHLLKNFAFKATNQRSALRTAREAELFGGVLSSTLTREHLAITAEFLRGDEPYFVELLSSVLTSSQFLPHELTESVLPTSIAESTAALEDPATRALELAHALAFRSSGLGSSLFAVHPSLKSLDAVKALASSAFTKGNVAVIGTGVDSAKLSQLVEKHLASLPSGAGAPSSGGSSQYFGGETRADVHGAGQAVFVGFGAPGAAPELAALHAHLDTTPALKWTAGSSPLAGTGAVPVYVPYSDAALFGVLVRAGTAAEASEGAKAAVAALKKVASGFGADEAKRAVAKAKFVAAALLEGREGLVAAVAPQVFGAPKADLASVHAALDKVSESSVTKTLSSLTKAKPTYVAVGDLHGLPYADELGL